MYFSDVSGQQQGYNPQYLQQPHPANQVTDFVFVMQEGIVTGMNGIGLILIPLLILPSDFLKVV